ncbi:MAG: hypothetical protein FWD98_06445, partial [Defluviitaleaceae bacterium]|nr:hypothetical protein [Defluviitaleaceae bacterium]
GVKVPYNQDFILPNGNQGFAPGMIGDPKDDINCRCFYIVDSDDNAGEKSYAQGVDFDADGGIIEANEDGTNTLHQSGAVSRHDIVRMGEHAELYYEEIRNRDPNSDIKAIARNTDFSEDDVRKIREHMFVNKYELDAGFKRFDPDYDMSVSWQNLVSGKNIREMDIIMLHHELMEHDLMNSHGMSYPASHEIAEHSFNYLKFVRELERKEGVF